MAAEALKSGSRLGPYELLSPLGAGGMGEVWKARDTRLDRVVAVKFSHAGFSDRFQREARAIAALNHPNIATLYDVGPDYLVMEYVEGAPIQPTDDMRKLLDIAVQTADGLAAAHSAGFVHRDLKPDNILLTKQGRVKILDFGLAKHTTKPAQDGATMTVATDPGTVMGTVAYMSPEQARGLELDASSDQFSFGLLLYELATGKRAFQRPTAAETMAAIIREDPEPLPDAVPPPLRWTIERLLSKEPADRYSSTRDLYLELRGLATRTTQVSPASTVPLTQTKRCGWTVPAAVLAAMVGAIATLAWLGMREPAGPDRLRVTPIAVEKDNEYMTKFSPDGRVIAFLRTIDRENHVFVRNSDTGVATQVTRRGEGVPWLLSWSRDGQTIYAVTAQQELVAVSASGGPPRRIVCGVRSQPSRWLVSPSEDSIITVEPASLSNGARQYRLLEWPFGGGPAKSLADLPIRTTCDLGIGAFSPDGTKLLFPCAHGPAILISYPGGKLREVASIPDTSQAAWMPDSRHAVVSTVAPRFRNDLLMADTEGAAARVLLSGIQEMAYGPSVSPSGKQIAVDRTELDFDLLEFNPEGAYAGELRATAVIESGLTWSPLGTAYAYREDGVGIWVRDADGRNPRLLVPGHAAGGASWSPDGRRIAFKVSGGVFAVLAEGGPRTALVPSIRDDRFSGITCWSPDGLWVAYTRPASVGGQLMKVSSAGGQQPVELVHEGVVNNAWAACSWSPDGERIAYRAADGVRVVASSGGDSRLITAGRAAQFLPDGRLFALVIDNDPLGAVLATFDPGSGRRLSRARLALPDAYAPTAVQAAAINPGGKRVAVSAGTSNSDIFVIEYFAEPVRGWRRFFRRWEAPAANEPR
jgi:serine/threonine protein kinase/Tol biopolymer transport system component